MKPKDKPVSKITTTQKNTNQKKTPKSSESMDMGSSLLKKNEFTLIIAGALVATIVVFFVFFKSSGPKTQSLPGLSPESGSSGSYIDLEKRIQVIESVLERLQPEGSGALGGASSLPAELAPLQQKVQRLETSVSVKLDSLIERMGKMESQIRTLNKKSSAAARVVKASAPAKTSKKTATKTLVKKTTKKPAKKAPMVHTVQKGETLWSISQKYKISVASLRKLNDLSSDATIYPGTNILVR
jgi:LysM repeat protein